MAKGRTRKRVGKAVKERSFQATHCVGCAREFQGGEKIALMAFTPQAWPDGRYQYPLCQSCLAVVETDPGIQGNIEAWLVRFNPELGRKHQESRHEEL